MNFKEKEPLIILIAGKARSGKNTIADYIKKIYQKKGKKVVISPYTKYLKQYIEEITEMPVTEENKPRELLQKISSDLIKKKLGKYDFFINRQIEDIEIYSYFMDVIIVPDVRFPEEIDALKKRFSNVLSIGVTRENYQSDLTEEQKQDITEISLDDYHCYDYQLKNEDKETLYQETLKIIKKIEERRNINE